MNAVPPSAGIARHAAATEATTKAHLKSSVNALECPACNGEPTYIGSLGRMLHLRCCECSWVWSSPMPEPEVTEFDPTMPMDVIA